MGLKKLFRGSTENPKKNIHLRNESHPNSGSRAASMSAVDQSRKTARQRLLGALALLLLAIVILPMVLDEEAKIPDIDLQLQIPTKDQDIKFSRQNTLPEVEKESITKELAAEDTSAQGISVSETLTPEQHTSGSTQAGGKQTPDLKNEPIKNTTTSSSSALSTKEHQSKKNHPVDTTVDQTNAEKTIAKQTDKSIEKTFEKAMPSVARLPSKELNKEPGKDQSKNQSDPKSNNNALSDPIASFANKSIGNIEGKPSGKLESKSEEQFTFKPATKVNHWIQIAAYSNETKARDMAGQIRTKGFPAVTEVVRTSGGDLYRVRVGPFESKESASRSRDKLNQSGFEGSLVQ